MRTLNIYTIWMHSESFLINLLINNHQLQNLVLEIHYLWCLITYLYWSDGAPISGLYSTDQLNTINKEELRPITTTIVRA